MSDEITHIFSHRVGMRVVVSLLVASGAMCPECGYGTRVTSKNWAKCKRCGARVARHKMEDIQLIPAPSTGEAHE